MVYRFSWIAGAAGIALSLLRLERLLRSSIDGLPWEIVLLAAAVLGGAITWAAVAYRLGARSVAAINLVAMTLTVIRIAVPGTTWLVFPTLESFSAMRTELEFARDVIRSGVAPVLPLAGVVAILAAVFWGLGALLSWGLLRNRPYLAVLPPLVVYLQFATMDRVPSGAWTWAFLVLLGLTLLAVAVDRRRAATGVLTSGRSRLAVMRSVPSLAVGSLVVVMMLAVLSTSAMAGLVPRSGLLDWRANSGLSGEYYGSASYNPFVGIRQDLISQSNVPVFVAEIGGEVNPEDLYWRLVTLDSYSGGQWYLDRDVDVRRPEELDGYEDPDHAFRGPSVPVVQEVTILALSQDWIPAVYAPREMEATNRAVDRGFRVKADDGSLRFDALSYRGMNYRVRSEVPAPDLDALARLPDGTLSRVFQAAVDDDEIALAPFRPSGGRDGEAPPEELDLAEEERFTLLPDDEDLAAVSLLAGEQVQGLETDYERALALEAFFRTGSFVYSTAVEPGHGAADLAAWLTDPESPNYRTGYCEQFATAMGVMARQIGIPSRVVLGFTPGTLVDGQLVVRDRNAHAWVELWMPNQGWVRFDPTPRNDDANPPSINDLPFDVVPYLEIPPAEPPIIEPGDLPDPVLPEDEFLPSTPLTVPPDGGPASSPFSIDLPGWVYAVLLGALVLFGLLPFVKWVRRRIRMRRLLHGDIGAAWQEIVDRLTDLGAGPRPSDTPREFADATEPAMEPLAEVYAETLYAPEVDWVAHGQRVSVATRSLDETVGRLGTRFSKLERIAAWYRLRSLTPGWWSRLRRRRRRG